MATKKTQKPSKTNEIAAVETAQVVEKVARLKRPDVLQSVSDLSIQVQDTLANLGVSLSGQLAQRDNLGVAIEASEARLKELFEVEQQLLDLDALKAERVESALAYQAELGARQEAYQQEDAEYQYLLKRARRDEADKYADRLANERKTEALQAAARKAELDDRESAVADAESEIEGLKEQVDGHEAAIKAAVGQAEAILKAVLTKDFNHKAEITAKDAESAAKLAGQEIASLRLQVASTQKLADDLNSQLADARAQVQEIASKAVEAGSGQQALAAIQQAQTSYGVNAKSTR